MIDAETQLMILLVLVAVPGAMIVSIVSGWIFDYLEYRRIKRIFATSRDGKDGCKP